MKRFLLSLIFVFVLVSPVHAGLVEYSVSAGQTITLTNKNTNVNYYEYWNKTAGYAFFKSYNSSNTMLANYTHNITAGQLNYQQWNSSLNSTAVKHTIQVTSGSLWIRADDTKITVTGVSPIISAPPAPVIVSGQWVEMPNYMSKSNGKYKITWTQTGTVDGFEVFRDGSKIADTGNVNYYYVDLSAPWLDPALGSIINVDKLDYTVKSKKSALLSPSSNVWSVTSPWDVPLLVGNVGWVNRLGPQLGLDFLTKDRMFKGLSSLLVASGMVFTETSQMADHVWNFAASLSVDAWDYLDRTFNEQSGNEISWHPSTQTAVQTYTKALDYVNGGSGIAIPQNTGRVITPTNTWDSTKPVGLPLSTPIPKWLDDLLNKDTTTHPDVITETGTSSPTYGNPAVPDVATTDGSIFQTLKDILAKIIALLSLLTSVFTSDFWIGNTANIQWNKLTTGLTVVTTKFPFSLPFDLYHLLNLVFVSPDVPVFDINLTGKSIMGIPITGFRIYHKMDYLAPYMIFFHSFILIGFSVGLIYKTKDLVGGAE